MCNEHFLISSHVGHYDARARVLIRHVSCLLRVTQQQLEDFEETLGEKLREAGEESEWVKLPPILSCCLFMGFLRAYPHVSEKHTLVSLFDGLFTRDVHFYIPHLGHLQIHKGKVNANHTETLWHNQCHCKIEYFLTWVKSFECICWFLSFNVSSAARHVMCATHSCEYFMFLQSKSRFFLSVRRFHFSLGFQ